MEPTPGTTRRAVLTVGVAVGVVGFTTTAITVGTRGMARELSLSTVELGWVVNAYLVAAAAFVVVGGRLGDVIGRTRAYGLGLVVFAVGSTLGVFAGGFGLLVLARVVQGLGAALILPSSIEIMAEYSRAGRESRAFRWRGLIYASSFAVGPLFGGVLTDWYSWRWIFGLDAALAVGSLVLLVLLAGRQGRGERAPTRDFVGAFLLAAMVGLTLILGERLPAWGIASPAGWISVAALVLLTVALVHHERRTSDPLIHPDLLQDRRVLGANVATIGASLGMLSLLYFFNLFAQSAATLEAEVIEVLLALGPFALSMWACAAFASWLGDRLGPRGPAIVGLGMMVLGFAVLSRTSPSTSELDVAFPLALAGIGAGIANASLTGVAVLHLPAGRINEAAGWLGLSRFVGSAVALGLGTASFLSVAPVPIAAPEPSTPAIEIAEEAPERVRSRRRHARPGPLGAPRRGDPGDDLVPLRPHDGADGDRAGGHRCRLGRAAAPAQSGGGSRPKTWRGRAVAPGEPISRPGCRSRSARPAPSSPRG